MIKWKDLDDVRIVLGSYEDYPDMSDSFVETAYHMEEDRYLTEEELDYVNSTFAEEIQERARDRAMDLLRGD